MPPGRPPAGGRRDDGPRDDGRRRPASQPADPPRDDDQLTGWPTGALRDDDRDLGGWPSDLDGDPGADGDSSTGRRRRARGEKGFERALDIESVADREDILRVPLAPTSRLISLAIAVFAALLGFALIFGGYTVPRSYGLIVFGVQALFVISWTIATRPVAPRVVAAIGLATAAVADLAVAWPVHATIAPLAYVLTAAFVAGVIGQLLRRTGRTRVVESLGATLVVVVGVIAYATLIVLRRHVLGTQSIAACLVAATVGIVVARLGDVIFPFPRTTPQVARGTVGIVAGAMVGTIAAAAVASALQGMHPSRTVIAGLVTAVVAVLADLGVGYAEASREIDGQVPSLWVVRHMQGPLGALALAAPVAYTLSVMVLVPALS